MKALIRWALPTKDKGTGQAISDQTRYVIKLTKKGWMGGRANTTGALVQGYGPSKTFAAAQKRCEQLQADDEKKSAAKRSKLIDSLPPAAQKAVRSGFRPTCLCTHGAARHGLSGKCRDCSCEIFEDEAKELARRVEAKALARHVAFVAAEPAPETTEHRRTVKTYKPHPAAELFPMMSAAELAELAADMKANGQHEPIVITEADLVLDGRNRLKAFELPELAGIEPEIQLWDREDDGISPTAWVISKNLRRRHLTEDQAAMVAVKALPLFEQEARARLKASGGDRRSGSATGALPGIPAASRLSAPAPTRKAPREAGKAAAAAGKSVGVPTRKVERAKWLQKTDPVRAQKVVDGELSLKKAEKEIKRAEQVAQVRVYRPPEGEFAVIVTDYPWKYDDALDGSDAIRGGCPYDPMTIEQICAFPLPVAKDCAVFMWVTNSHLIDPNAYAVVAKALSDRYQLVPKQIRTWRKVTLDGTRDKFGGGYVWRNNTEHLVRFERGHPVFNPVTQTTCFEAPLGDHSEKPQRAFDDIMALCPGGPMLEMFARDGERPGWVTTGAELLKKPTARQQLVNDLAEIVEEVFPAKAVPPTLVWRGNDQIVQAEAPSGRLYDVARSVRNFSTGEIDKDFTAREIRESTPDGYATWIAHGFADRHAAKVACEEEEARRVATPDPEYTNIRITPKEVEAANARQRKRKKLLIEDVAP